MKAVSYTHLDVYKRQVLNAVGFGIVAKTCLRESSDGAEMFDASDEIYEHIMCCICPVKLSKMCIRDRHRRAF